MLKAWSRTTSPGLTTLLPTSNLFDVTAHIQVTNPDRPSAAPSASATWATSNGITGTATTPAKCTTALAATIVPVLRDGISTRTI